jgi:hypothetical protein
VEWWQSGRYPFSVMLSGVDNLRKL